MSITINSLTDVDVLRDPSCVQMAAQEVTKGDTILHKNTKESYRRSEVINQRRISDGPILRLTHMTENGNPQNKNVALAYVGKRWWPFSVISKCFRIWVKINTEWMNVPDNFALTCGRDTQTVSGTVNGVQEKTKFHDIHFEPLQQPARVVVK